MTRCNKCGGSMLPDDDALVPALSCLACGRSIPRTSVSYRQKGSDKATLNRALRAHTRKQMKEKQLADVLAEALVEHCKEN